MKWLRDLWAVVSRRYFFIVCPVCTNRVRFKKGEVATWAVGKRSGRWSCKDCHTDITFLLGCHEFTERARREHAALRESDPVDQGIPSLEKPIASARKEIN